MITLFSSTARIDLDVTTSGRSILVSKGEITLSDGSNHLLKEDEGYTVDPDFHGYAVGHLVFDSENELRVLVREIPFGGECGGLYKSMGYKVVSKLFKAYIDKGAETFSDVQIIKVVGENEKSNKIGKRG